MEEVDPVACVKVLLGEDVCIAARTALRDLSLVLNGGGKEDVRCRPGDCLQAVVADHFDPLVSCVDRLTVHLYFFWRQVPVPVQLWLGGEVGRMVDKDQFEEPVPLRLGLGVDHLFRRGVVEAE